MIDPWSCWPVSCPCLYPKQSWLHKTTTCPCRGHFIFLSGLHPFLLLVTSPQFSFGVAGLRRAKPGQSAYFIFQVSWFVEAERACRAGQSIVNQSWDLCGAVQKERSSLLSLIERKPGFFGSSTWWCAENEGNIEEIRWIVSKREIDSWHHLVWIRYPARPTREMFISLRR